MKCFTFMPPNWHCISMSVLVCLKFTTLNWNMFKPRRKKKSERRRKITIAVASCIVAFSLLLLCTLVCMLSWSFFSSYFSLYFKFWRAIWLLAQDCNTVESWRWEVRVDKDRNDQSTPVKLVDAGFLVSDHFWDKNMFDFLF